LIQMGHITHSFFGYSIAEGLVNGTRFPKDYFFVEVGLSERTCGMGEVGVSKLYRGSFRVAGVIGSAQRVNTLELAMERAETRDAARHRRCDGL
jgi:hypothetical protein